MSRYDPRDMLVFAKVADLSSISAAARALGTSKASVSRSVSRLEAALNARLLERSPRHLAVTEVGRIFLAYCRKVAEEIEAAESAVGELQAAVRGHLRVAVPLVFGRAVLAPALPRFLIQHPEVNMEVRLTNRRVDPIEEGFDLVVRVGPQPDSSLLMRELGRALHGIYASPGYLRRAGGIEHPSELQSHAVLDVSDGADHIEWGFQRGETLVRVPVTPRLDLNDAVIRRDAAIEDLGVALLPSWLCSEAVADGCLVPLCTDWESTRVNHIVALWPGRRNALPRLRAFLDFLAASMPAELERTQPPGA
jgi:LysR family transcriptional regulator, regulator for bpeEF and oprC